MRGTDDSSVVRLRHITNRQQTDSAHGCPESDGAAEDPASGLDRTRPFLVPLSTIGRKTPALVPTIFIDLIVKADGYPATRGPEMTADHCFSTWRCER
jgi:hypothetical protein